jgi:hypothetical protein
LTANGGSKVTSSEYAYTLLGRGLSTIIYTDSIGFAILSSFHDHYSRHQLFVTDTHDRYQTLDRIALQTLNFVSSFLSAFRLVIGNNWHVYLRPTKMTPFFSRSHIYSDFTQCLPSLDSHLLCGRLFRAHRGAPPSPTPIQVTISSLYQQRNEREYRLLKATPKTFFHSF